MPLLDTMNFRLIAIVYVMAGLLSHDVAGQNIARPSDSELLVMSAAAQYMIDGLIDGHTIPDEPMVVVDPAVLPESAGEHGLLWDGLMLQEAADSIGAAIGNVDQFRVCATGAIPPRCTLVGADAIVSLGIPRIDGNVGLITVRVVHRAQQAPDPQAAFYVETAFELRRTTGPGWQVVGRRVISVN